MPPKSILSQKFAGASRSIWLKGTFLFSATIALCLFTTPIHAGPITTSTPVLRTYVSGSGNDGNPCSLQKPCKTLQEALKKTRPGGQINALNSADYGYVTVNKGVSIVGARGVAGVLATSAVTGITINAGPNDTVSLQGLEIDGAGSGINGIQFTSGASLSIRDSVIRGFTNGINFQPIGSSALSVDRTLISNN